MPKIKLELDNVALNAEYGPSVLSNAKNVWNIELSSPTHEKHKLVWTDKQMAAVIALAVPADQEHWPKEVYEVLHKEADPVMKGLPVDLRLIP